MKYVSMKIAFYPSAIALQTQSQNSGNLKMPVMLTGPQAVISTVMHLHCNTHILIILYDRCLMMWQDGVSMAFFSLQ